MIYLFQVNVVAAPQSTPLTFVFSTYEAANWVINLPEGVTVAHVFLVSCSDVISSGGANLRGSANLLFDIVFAKKCMNMTRLACPSCP